MCFDLFRVVEKFGGRKILGEDADWRDVTRCTKSGLFVSFVPFRGRKYHQPPCRSVNLNANGVSAVLRFNQAPIEKHP